MKKVLLGLLALSAVSFAASEGTQDAVSMDISVKANVIEASEVLMMEGEAGGTFGDALVLNFGDVIIDKSASTSGKVKVYRGNGTEVLKPAKMKADGTGLDAPIETYTKFTAELGLTTAGVTAWGTNAIEVPLVSGTEKMNSTVKIDSINDGNANQYMITVGASLAAADVTKAGNFVGGAAIRATVSK